MREARMLKLSAAPAGVRRPGQLVTIGKEKEAELSEKEGKSLLDAGAIEWVSEDDLERRPSRTRKGAK